MSAPRSPHRDGSSLKRKRPTAHDVIDEQPPNRPLADISNMCSPHDPSYAHSPMSSDLRDSSPLRGPRGHREREIAQTELRFTSQYGRQRDRDRDRDRDIERDRETRYNDRSRSPDRRHSLGRYDGREYDRRAFSSTYRPNYSETRAGIHSDLIRGKFRSSLF
jgi:hypothetical protein